jgi:hypothetical protein
VVNLIPTNSALTSNAAGVEVAPELFSPDKLASMMTPQLTHMDKPAPTSMTQWTFLTILELIRN